MTDSGVHAVLAALRAATDQLLTVDFSVLGDAEFPAVWDAFETERRRLEAADVALVAATDAAHVAARHCRSSTADLLTHRLRVSPAQARARVRRARDLGPRRTLVRRAVGTHPPCAGSGAARGRDLVPADRRSDSSGTLPDAGGAPVTILARVEAVDLDRRDALVQSEHGDLVRLRTLTRLAGDAELIPVLFDRTADDTQLYLGRTRRLASREQRRALALRDGGCSFPGCDRPSSWTEVHHIVEWAAGGGTDIANLCLVCAYHHREFGRRGWRVQMSEGRPHLIPPAWLDPARTPVLNTAHHLPEIVFDPDGAITARLRR